MSATVNPVLKQPLTYFQTGPLDHAAAGIVAGFISCVLIHPFDLVKVNMQVEKKNKNTAHAFKRVYQKRGVRGLYQGLTPNLTGNVVAWGVYFWGYNHLKLQIRNDVNNGAELTYPQLMGSAAAASLGCMLVTNPFWVVKTRMMLQTGSASDSRPSYNGLRSALGQLMAKEGIRGLYAGFSMGVVNVSHGAIQFTAFDKLKSYLLLRKQQDQSMPLAREIEEKPTTFSLRGDAVNLSVPEFLACVTLSKSAAGIATYPSTVLRSRLQDARSTSSPGGNNVQVSQAYSSVMDCVRKTYAENGVRSFYRGLPLHLARVIPHTCLLFTVYEQIRSSLSAMAEAEQDAGYRT
jgi:solute carrier family 25 folate transporter 32